MGTTWKTKWGPRRVKQAPATLDEALIAAESLTEDFEQKVAIAASLMGAPIEEVRALAAKQSAHARGRPTVVAGRSRAVVVEYKRPRPIRAPMPARGR